MGKESARHFFSTIHQVQTGPSSDLPKPLTGVHAQRPAGLEVGVGYGELGRLPSGQGALTHKWWSGGEERISRSPFV